MIGGKDYKSFHWEVPGEGGAPPRRCARSFSIRRMAAVGLIPALRSSRAYLERGRFPWTRAPTGLRSERMLWCVWSIAEDGQVSVSEVRRFQFPTFKY